jgi:hypothetical protein
VLRGLRRKYGTAVHAKQPISVPLLTAMVTACGDSYRGLQERALLLLGFAGAFRRSELVALTRADLHFVPEGVIVRVRRSKTDPEGAGMLKGIPIGTHTTTCPILALHAWFDPGASFAAGSNTTTSRTSVGCCPSPKRSSACWGVGHRCLSLMGVRLDADACA